MGIPRRGSATSEGYDPSLGRGLGAGSAYDQPVSNGPLSVQEAVASMPIQQQGMAGIEHQGMNMQRTPDVSRDANAVRGFPQDAFMEGPLMAIDERVDKPENYGLRPGWSGFMQGMMTFVRVLPPELFDKIMEMKKQALKAHGQ